MTGADKFAAVELFMERVREDPRVTTAHISLYIGLICLVDENVNSINVFSREMMPVCKISGSATYHRCIQELNEFGYIKYVPSYNHFKGSRVEFVFNVGSKANFF